MNKKLRYFLCGLAMGAADTVPGVSGGTIAFITGIYENLLNAIKSVDVKFFKLFFRGELKAAFSQIPWGFCLPLISGIAIAIISLANVVIYLMDTHSYFVWAFFFGLIAASLFILIQDLMKIRGHVLISSFFFAIGAIFAIWLTHSNPVTLSHTYPILFFSGFIAICAMILPGISGAFILVLLGQYKFILQSITTFNLPVLFIFALGCICGLLSFAHVISACLKKYYKPSLAFLSGVLAGSLIMLWPFSTQEFQLTGQTFILIALILFGLAIPLLLHKFSRNND